MFAFNTSDVGLVRLDAMVDDSQLLGIGSPGCPAVLCILSATYQYVQPFLDRDVVTWNSS